MLLTEPATLLQALLLALALDALIGDPAWLYRRVPHPVALIGGAISRLERRWLDLSQPGSVLRRRGLLLGLVIVATSALVGLGLQWVCLRIPFGWLLLGLLMSSFLAQRGLYEHVAAVAKGLCEGLSQGRAAVAHIVGRDPDQLDAPAVARAAIESTAENFADGVVAPVLWGAALGLPGMLAYKTINTADSMIGHLSPRHADFGRFAARLDDAASFLPARLAALLILAAACLFPGAMPAAGWRAMRRDASLHRSVNAGWPEAAMAGSLGLRLAGPRRYGGQLVEDAWMGDGTPLATPREIHRALRILVRACILTAAPIALALVLTAG
ncbi:MAG: adenosylcobinamide-phosphate synthase CbiB [Geminicoccaceae bacterium]